MELVEDNIVRLKLRNFFVRHAHQLGIGQERDVLRLPAVCGGFQILKLRFIDIGAGREPADAIFGIVLAEFEGNEGFARAGGVNDGGFAGFG